MRYRLTSCRRLTFLDFETVESALALLSRLNLSDETVVLSDKQTGGIVYMKSYN